MEDNQIVASKDAYDQSIASLSNSELAHHLNSQVVKWEKFNAYKPPSLRMEPIKNNYIIGSLALSCFPCLSLVSTAFTAAEDGIYVKAFVSIAIGVVIALGSYGLCMIGYKSSRGLYEADLKMFEHWEWLQGMYFAGARRLLPQCMEPVEVTHDTYRPRPGETLMLAIRAGLFAFRDRVVSRSQSGGATYQESATLRHAEGVGLLAVTSKGLNFLSDDHRSNIFLKWKDIAMLESDNVYLMVQPYSGKVRFFAAQGVGVDPASDPIVLKLYIESVRELAEA